MQEPIPAQCLQGSVDNQQLATFRATLQHSRHKRPQNKQNHQSTMIH